MALMTNMQRRRSGVYEFRKRLPQALAGKDVPAHMRGRFPDLINSSTGKFKREVVQSLCTKEPAAAKKRDLQAALKFTAVMEEALTALTSPGPASQLPSISAKEIGEAVYRQLLADDEAERLMGDDRRRTPLVDYREELGREAVVDRAMKWPDLVPLQPASGFGMQIDHAEAYGEATGELADEYRAAYARRDPSIVFPETATELKRRGVPVDMSSQEFHAAALEVLGGACPGLRGDPPAQ